MNEYTNLNGRAALAGAAMASLVGATTDSGEYLSEKVSVGDLWLILDHLIPVVRKHLIEEGQKVGTAPPDLTPDELLVWNNAAVRGFIRDEKKIQAIKEARSLTGMSLKEAKDFVERMEAMRKATGGTAWLL
jgi:hypothetical protein